MINKLSKTNGLVIGGVVLCSAVLVLTFLVAVPFSANAAWCMKDSDCGQDYWERQFCEDNDVYGVYVDRSCFQPSDTSVGTCTESRTDRLIDSCASSQICTQNYFNSASCVGEDNEGSSTPGSGSDSGSTYNSHSYTQCYGSSIYWYDSNNSRQDLYRSCAYNQSCSGNACVDSYTYPTQPTYISHIFKGCVNNVSYWYDSLGNQQDIYQNCGLTGQTCQNGSCVGSIYTITPTPAPAPTQAPAYALHYVTKCNSNDIYWYDSKDEVQSLFQTCSDDNQCTFDTCGDGRCSNELKCDGSTCAADSADYIKYCASSAAISETATKSENPFLNLIKKWYVWIILAIVLIILFVIVFRRLSSNT